MVRLQDLLLLAFFVRGVFCLFVNPPDASVSTGTSTLQYVVGSIVNISWDLPSTATQAQAKLYLWLDPGNGGEILTNSTTLDHFTWNVSTYGINGATFHLTLYPENAVATAGQGYFTSETFGIVAAPVSSSSSTSSSQSSPSTSISSTSPTASSPTTTPTTTLTPSPTPSPTYPPSPHSGLTQGAKIGLGVGLALGAVIFAIIAFICGKRYRRSRANKTIDTPELSSAPYYDRAELPWQHKGGMAQQIPPAEMEGNGGGVPPFHELAS